MKAALFRNDNMGVVVGRLKTPTLLQYEYEGSIRLFNLVGNVVDTEYNDILVLGRRIDEDTLEVVKMESIPRNEDGYLAFKAEGEQGDILCAALPIGMLADVESRISEKGNHYRILRFQLGKNNSLYLTAMGEFDEHPASDCYVFVLNGALKKEVKEFGEGYAVRKQTTQYGIGRQVMS